MKFAFSLEWDELDDDLQQTKIEEVITYDWENENLDREKYPHVLDALDDDYLRDDVERLIARHFPIYF